MGDSPCLIQIQNRFQVSDYRNIWHNERWKPYEKYSKHHYLFHMQNLFQNGAKDISEMVNIMYRFLSKDPDFV